MHWPTARRMRSGWSIKLSISPATASDGTKKRGRSALWARSLHIATHPMRKRLKPPTGRPWPSLANWACVRSWPIATWVSASSTDAPRKSVAMPANISRLPRRCTARWTCDSGWIRPRRRWGRQAKRPMKKALVLASALILVGATLALGTGDLRAEETPRTGGILKIATMGEPPTLDIQMSTTILTYEIMWHVFESLFTYDHALNPIPLLAESHEVGDRGLRHTITLRRDVRFHHGMQMTAADVVSSLKRWGRVATLGRVLWNDVESIEAKDSYTVVLRLKQPSASLVYGLAEPAAMIYPRELVEPAGDVPIKAFIGTGPYRFVEHKPDRHIKLARFADYAARAEPPNGFGGRRVAWLDEILFIPMPDVAARLAGVEAGGFHLGQVMEPDAFERIRNLPALEPRIIRPQAWALASLNHKAGLMT